ncbi:MAG TPA: hypothetical protein VEI57_06580 [Nitrospirota bacterium]|nr:hypothetical protein [Nitrospirota bacterium]
MPLAVNCWGSPIGMIELNGTTSIDCSVTVGASAVSVVLPEKPPRVAVIVAVPAPIEVASTLEYH